MSTVAHELRDINFTRGKGWYITMKMRKINNGKIEVVSFVIKFGTVTIDVQFEINVNK
jgi:hypothetical protein